MGIKKNIEIIKDEIFNTAINSKRKPEDITLICVSKTFSAEKVEEAIKAGEKNFGENYVQDFLSKYDILKDRNINWHFIGHLQSNKIKYIYDKIYMLHTLDSLKLAEKLNNRMKQENKKLNVLVQVNIGKENSKNGLCEEDLESFFEKAENYRNLLIKGFMTIPPFSENPEKVRPYFKKLRENLEYFSKFNNNENIMLKHLSMGMTNDYKIAIEEGATYIRIGTAVFGERSCKKIN